MRILLAHDPRSYREVLAATLRLVRPHVEVRLAAPEDLDHAVVCWAPHLVLCSRRSIVVLTHVPAWILLYPGGAATSVVRSAGEERTLADLTLDDILTFVDERACVDPGSHARPG